MNHYCVSDFTGERKNPKSQSFPVDGLEGMSAS